MVHCGCETQALQKLSEMLERYETLDMIELASLCRQVGVRGHIAVMVQPYLDYVLKGMKLIESRFTTNRVSPFGQVRAKDVILLKESGGPITAGILVSNVEYFGPMKEGDAGEIIKKNNEALKAQDSFREQKKDSKFGTLIHIQEVCPIEAVQLRKKDRRPWVVLSTLEDGRMCQAVLEGSLGNEQ